MSPDQLKDAAVLQLIEIVGKLFLAPSLPPYLAAQERMKTLEQLQTIRRVFEQGREFPLRFDEHQRLLAEMQHRKFIADVETSRAQGESPEA